MGCLHSKISLFGYRESRSFANSKVLIMHLLCVSLDMCFVLQDILEKIQVLSPRALIIDSIQTVYLKGVAGSAGGLSQVTSLQSLPLQEAKIDLNSGD